VTVRVWLSAGAIVAFSGAGSGCHHHRHVSAADAAVRADSLRGVVSVNGTGFEQHIVLHAGDRAFALMASASDSAALTRVGGAEVVVRGVAAGDSFSVASFVVRSIEGAPVLDGVLMKSGDRLVLRSEGGELALGNPPAELASMVGARVWIRGPLDAGPNSYGVIVPVSARQGR
jgi:hypothetical protein